jgi:transposase-like protein
MIQPVTKKQRLWQSRLEAAYASGLSLSEYAQQHKLPLKQLYAWRSRFKRMAEHGDAGSNAFVRIDTKTAARTFIEIHLPNGVQLHVNELTADLLRMLQSP